MATANFFGISFGSGIARIHAIHPDPLAFWVLLLPDALLLAIAIAVSTKDKLRCSIYR
ncbi:MAG: hypothetical protein HXY43_14995 [Fischerella sp.]|uniref:hypothetical protein n=1 Tax=Fischerella sp. TaxID=1191 RepID=UPI00178F3C92|nr:hypothetical protein [Fischerella sp.]NWF60526.1 hypothetical protein [Fischerella sp.]